MKREVPESIRPQLEQISQRLWNNKAVVMVGAGFSKNASAAYPDWGQLGDKLYKLAHGKVPNGEDKAYLSLLKVAQEAEALVGRPAVDAILQSEIPDLEVAPSELHSNLLQLPWNDVFTTNYDTLLERATGTVVKHRYSTVVDQNDLPYAEKPRIIKLHGSFRSNRPLVITEEDYRVYPVEKAPFVNTVQQALLENTLVLIGFSGDDPNFLHWIGWIRDHLGNEHIQPIYLITSSQFSTAQSKLLGKRNIHVIDMSLCNLVACDDHSEGLRVFMNFLTYRNPNRLDWPSLENTYEESLKAPRNSLELKHIQNAMSEWKVQRERYPGWLILPHKNRNKLYYATEGWIGIKESDHEIINSFCDGTDICFIFELVWRLEKCLHPMFDNIAEVAKLMVDKYWPFKSINTSELNSINMSGSKYSELNWMEIRFAWLALTFALLRYYREEGKTDDWHYIQKLLVELNKYLSDDQKEQKQYQEYLFELFNLDVIKAKQRLLDWEPKTSQPYWQYIQITARMELEQLDNPSLLIGECLAETRRLAQNRNNLSPYIASSQEAYQMLMQKWGKLSSDKSSAGTVREVGEMEKAFLSKLSTQNQGTTTNKFDIDVDPSFFYKNAQEDWQDLTLKKDNERKEEWNKLLREVRHDSEWFEDTLYNARLDELKALGIDPLGETTYLQLSLGQKSNDQSLQGIDSKIRHAYSLLRFSEETGIPFRFSFVSLMKDSAIQAISSLAKHSSNWCRVTLLRLGDAKAVDILFGPQSLTALSNSETDKLVDYFIAALASCSKTLKDKNFKVQYSFEYQLAHVIPEVLSRLCSKCSLSHKEKIWELIIDRYGSDNKNNYANIASLTRRLINSLSDKERLTWIPRLLSLPTAVSLTPYTKREYLNPFLWFDIDKVNLIFCNKVNLSEEHFTKLIANAETTDDKRKWALISLIRLHQFDLLNSKQKTSFGKVLWKKIDSEGFPENTEGYYRFAFIDLPSPENIKPIERFKNYIKKQTFPIQHQSKSYTLTFGNIDLVHNLISASNNKFNIFGREDAELWLNYIIEWWDADKNRLVKELEKPPNVSLFGEHKEFHARLQRINELLASVIIPSFSAPIRKDSQVRLNVTRLLNEMQSEGLHTLEAEAVWIESDIEIELLKKIEFAISSQDDGCVHDGLKAMSQILLIRQNIDLEQSTKILLADFIRWSRTIKLSQGLWICIRLLRENPAAYSQLLKDAVNGRLQALLAETDLAETDSIFEFDDRLSIRKVAVRLASELSAYYQRTQETAPSVINQWQNIAFTTNEFSEIRHAWICH
ncbi:MAG: SIR2 family protein [Paraglaciecola sp.]|uniref:SIR2 family NAD-dependent protein deacylase n=1 Tax=Paraglaciecola sp. TaxID=1920173 RepID=UPI00329A2E01